jgi:hypothetical protein
VPAGVWACTTVLAATLTSAVNNNFFMKHSPWLGSQPCAVKWDFSSVRRLHDDSGD